VSDEAQASTVQTASQHTAPPGSTAFRGASRAEGYVEGHGREDEVAEAVISDVPMSAEAVKPPPNGATPAARLMPADRDSDLFDVFDVFDPDQDLGLLATAPAERPARRGLRGLLSRMGFTMTPGKAEQGERDLVETIRRDEETIRQATWTRAVSVLVANPKGGVGKTPTAIIAGGVLAASRGGSVCIMEVSDDPGALAFRAEGHPPRGLGDLVRDVDTITNAGQLAGYTAPQTSFASVIGTVGRRPRLTGADVIAVADVVDKYFGIRVMDSGNQPSSSAFQAAVDAADALVIPVFNAGDAVLEAAALLGALRSAGGRTADLADSAIILRLTDGRPENSRVVERVDHIIANTGVQSIFTIPYDPHIAERGQITLAHLEPATRRAFTAAAASVVRTLQENVR